MRLPALWATLVTMSNRSAARRIFLPFFFFLFALSSFTVPAQTKSIPAPLKADRLMGMKVENQDGHKIGTLSNLILDTRTGRVKYAVISSGGFMGARATLRLAPAAFISTGTILRDTLAVNTTTPRWNLAPAFKASQMETLGTSTRESEITAYFKQPEIRTADTQSKPLPPTGAMDNNKIATQRESLKFASDLIGLRVVNLKQEKVGNVVDLLVCFKQSHPAFAIISSGRFARQKHRFAVPLTSLITTDSKNTVVVNANSDTLEQAPLFSLEVWDSHGTGTSARFYHYPESEN